MSDPANPIVSVPVDDPDLPNELKGKSPSEIVEFYRKREEQFVERIDAATRANNPPTTPAAPVNVRSAEPTPQDWWNDPAKAVKAVAVTREEFTAATAMVQNNMIEMAALLASRKFADWNKWEGKIREVLGAVAGHLKADPTQWETAYYYVKGQDYDRGVQEATVTATRRATEVPSPVPAQPVVPEKLSAEEQYVAKGLGQTEEKFKEGKKNLAEDNWPITFDSRKRR